MLTRTGWEVMKRALIETMPQAQETGWNVMRGNLPPSAICFLAFVLGILIAVLTS